MKCACAGLQSSLTNKAGDCWGKVDTCAAQELPAPGACPSWLPWGCWEFTGLKSRLQVWPTASFLRRGRKSPLELLPLSSPSLFWLEQNLLSFSFFLFFHQKLEAVFCSQEWSTVARNDVKHDKMLPGQEGDFFASLWRGKSGPIMNEEFPECAFESFSE